MKLTLSAVCIAMLILLNQSCYAQQSPDELRMELLKDENSKPSAY
jgi:hypothetical protein